MDVMLTKDRDADGTNSRKNLPFSSGLLCFEELRVQPRQASNAIHDDVPQGFSIARCRWSVPEQKTQE